MARGGALFPSELFNDVDFGALPARAQRLLMWLWVHPDLSTAGVIAIQAREWAAAAGDLTEQVVEEDADALKRAGWVDHDAGQLWLWPFMKLDNALRSPTTYISAARSIKTVKSRRLREAAYRVFAAEPMPVKALDGLEGEKAAKRASMNAAVERAADELRHRVSAPSVLSAITPADPASVAPSMPHPMPRVDVDDGVDDEADGGNPAPCKRCGNEVPPERRTVAALWPHLCGPCVEAEKDSSSKVAAW